MYNYTATQTQRHKP